MIHMIRKHQANYARNPRPSLAEHFERLARDRFETRQTFFRHQTQDPRHNRPNAHRGKDLFNDFLMAGRLPMEVRLPRRVCQQYKLQSASPCQTPITTTTRRARMQKKKDGSAFVLIRKYQKISKRFCEPLFSYIRNIVGSTLVPSHDYRRKNAELCCKVVQSARCRWDWPKRYGNSGTDGASGSMGGSSQMR
jgi:hypothetical protein